MKTQSARVVTLCIFAMCALTLNTFAADQVQPLPQTTRLSPYGVQGLPGSPAPALPATEPSLRSSQPATTNGSVQAQAQALVSTFKREIQTTEFGASATWGRTKVNFPSDLSSPITVVTPDGRHLSFRPTFLVLENRATQEAVLLGTVTNRDVGTVHLPNSVVWTNIFDSGPRVSLELIYDGAKGKLEQNVILQESLGPLPSGWSASDVALECWTAWWQDSGPAPSVQSRTISLVPADSTNTAVQASDATVSFGASRITAGGSAFSVDSDAEPLPVAKSWIQANPPGFPSSYLIEAVDLSSAQSQIQALPGPVRQSSLEPRKGKRSDILQLQASVKPAPIRTAKNANRPMLVAKSETSPRVSSSSRSSKFNVQGSKFPSEPRRLSALTSPLSPLSSRALATEDRTSFAGPAFAIDFTLTETVPLPPNAISWWPGGANALDALTNHNDGTEYNGLAYAAGEVGQGFSLDGVAAHAHVTDSASLHVTNAVTFEAWVNPSSYGPDDGDPWYRDIIGKWDVAGWPPQKSYDFSLSPDSYAYILVTSTGDDPSAAFVMTTNALPYDTWTHVAGVYDGSAIRMYLNGQPDNSGGYTNGIFPGTHDLGIGGFVGGGDPGDVGSPFRGIIDEPTMYARALSASEIQAIYNAGPAGKSNPDCVAASTNAVGWWPGDGNAYDFAHTNMGTLFNGATFASAVVGQGFSFDGSTSYMVVSNAPDLNPTNGLTIEAWVYLNWYECDNHPILSKDAQVPGNRQYLLTVSDNCTFRYHIGLADGSFPYHDGNTTVEAATWYHVAMTYDSGSSNVVLYVNGAPDDSFTAGGPMLASTEPVFIGGTPNPNFPYFWPGLIDEPTIYNRALSDTEIAMIYSAGCAGKCKTDSDSDGLTDLQEAFLGTNPNNADTDGDGVPDGIEFFQGRNPRISATAADTNDAINLQVFTPLK